jgi:SAM-dependent methyltransferase
MKERFRNIPECIVCGSCTGEARFIKKGTDDAPFELVACAYCGLEFLHPRPNEEEIAHYYAGNYFLTRTDRGYDNYFSEDTRREIERVITLNLSALSFNSFEKTRTGRPRSLDIGCAAGYFVAHMRDRGWDAQGIDISEPCTSFAKRKLGLNVLNGNYLETVYLEKFDLITMWATIEHLHHPELVLDKARRDLRDDGMLVVSTCRQGGISFMRLFGNKWRFYNFPEHLFFFSLPNLKSMLRKRNFSIHRSFTYGSGFGTTKSVVRKIADFMARRLRMGDMMVVAAIKKKGARMR